MQAPLSYLRIQMQLFQGAKQVKDNEAKRVQVKVGEGESAFPDSIV